MSTRQRKRDIISETLERAAWVADDCAKREAQVFEELPKNDERRPIYRAYALMAGVIALKIRALKPE